jgi:hypothetical protein
MALQESAWAGRAQFNAKTATTRPSVVRVISPMRMIMFDASRIAMMSAAKQHPTTMSRAPKGERRPTETNAATAA